MSAKSLPTYKEIASFFIPLAMTGVLIQISHSLVNAGVARTNEPEIALAAYALARSGVRLIENPMFMVRQTVVSLVKDRQSYNEVRSFIYKMAGAITVVLALIGFSPLGYRFLSDVMGATEPIAVQGQLALRVLFLLPITAVVRNLYNGVAIISRQTVLVPVSSAVRVGTMAALIFPMAAFTEWPGAVIASITFVGGFAAEAVIMRWRGRPLLKRGKLAERRESTPLSQAAIRTFFWPLVLTTFVATAFEPMVNTGLARSVSPEIALAAFAVGHALGMLIAAPLQMLHQCTLVFTRVGVPQTYAIVRRFVMVFSLGTALLLAGISFSSAGIWLLEGVIGLSPTLSPAALEVMRVLTLFPIVHGWREYLWGIFMQQRTTKLIGAGKGVNLVVVIAVLVGLLSTQRTSPAAAGAWALVFGEFSECVFMQFYYRETRRHPETPEAGLGRGR